MSQVRSSTLTGRRGPTVWPCPRLDPGVKRSHPARRLSVQRREPLHDEGGYRMRSSSPRPAGATAIGYGSDERSRAGERYRQAATACNRRGGATRAQPRPAASAGAISTPSSRSAVTAANGDLRRDTCKARVPIRTARSSSPAFPLMSTLSSHSSIWSRARKATASGWKPGDRTAHG